ncbi:MAG: efflux RND transporter periplasmic adaptor subunit [Planctomycetota bacterium]
MENGSMHVVETHGRGSVMAIGVALAWAAATVANADPKIAIEGFSQPYRVAEIAASTTGIIERRLVPEGQRVVADQPLMQLESSVQDAMLQIAEAAMESEGELQSARAAHQLRQERLVAIRELASRQHATQDELRRALTEAELAQAELKAAQERKLVRKLEYDKLAAQAALYRVKAPFDGVVARFHKQCGEYVGPADPVVCTLVELTRLSVNLLVDRTQMQGIELGRQAELWFIDAGRAAKGQIYYISPYPDGETGTYVVKALVDNSEGAFAAGERCRLIGVADATPQTAFPVRRARR